MTAYYTCMLGAMIADWRLQKGMGDFAFNFVQLPPSLPPGSPTDQQTGRMEIRVADSQLLPRVGGTTDITGMAVVLDLGGKSAWGYDHPPNKPAMVRKPFAYSPLCILAAATSRPGGSQTENSL